MTDARCVRCVLAVPVEGHYYCAECLVWPQVILKRQAWNGFSGVPNPRPYCCTRIPYELDGTMEEWTEWVWSPRFTGLRLWWEHVLLYTGLYRLRGAFTQPGWNDERPD